MTIPSTDDDVLDWWEAYDSGVHVKDIARQSGYTAQTITRKLKWLGVWVGPQKGARRRKAGKHATDPSLDEWQRMGEGELPRLTSLDYLARFKDGTLEEAERELWDAVAKLGAPREGVEGRPLPYARSLPHVKPNARGRVPMSGRERSMHKLGWGQHRRAVRDELRAAGLLPRLPGTKVTGRYFA